MVLSIEVVINDNLITAQHCVVAFHFVCIKLLFI